MSACADIQKAITDRLVLTHVETVVDGSPFTITHNLGQRSLPHVTVRAALTEALKIEDADYSITGTDINSLVLTAEGSSPDPDGWEVTVSGLAVPGLLWPPSDPTKKLDGSFIPVVRRRTKSLPEEINAASANKGLCIFVMPVLPTRAVQGSDFVFFTSASVRVRIIEQPAINSLGIDGYDLIDDIADSLQWQTLGGILGHPLQLAEQPTAAVEDHKFRIIDVLFEAVYGHAPIP